MGGAGEPSGCLLDQRPPGIPGGLRHNLRLVRRVFGPHELDAVRSAAGSIREVADEDRATDLNLVAIPERAFAGERAIDEGAVGAPLVNHPPAFSLGVSQEGVPPGGLGVMQTDIVGGPATDGDFVLGELEPLPLIGPLDQK